MRPSDILIDDGNELGSWEIVDDPDVVCPHAAGADDRHINRYFH